MDTVTINLDILDWVASRIGTSRDDLPATIATRKADRERIAAGHLTVSQVEKIAQKARVPFGVLFLEKPPTTPRLDIPDLRQTPDPAPLSEDFVEVYTDALAKHDWYRRQLLTRDARPPTFVGKFRFGQRLRADEVATDILKTLDISDADRSQSQNADAYFSRLAMKAENAGVLVMKASYVKAQTRRALSVKEFRGFAVADKLAPLILINGRDAEVATVFTLMHELAHIWLGQSGVSDVTLIRSRGLEQFCNQIAARILLPETALKRVWLALKDVIAVAKHFRVSRFVAGIHLVHAGYITQEELNGVLETKLIAKKKGPVSQMTMIPIRNSRRLTRELVYSAARGETLYREAASLLNVKPDTVVALFESMRKKRIADR